MAVVDADYKFLYIDVGASGRAGDAGVFNDSKFKKALVDNTINLPPPVPLETTPELNSEMNYHLVGDDAFSLQLTMMKPYPHRNLEKAKRVFNYRLSRARRVVENSFGILANRFRVFHTTINLNPDKVTNIILAACCLHNIMCEKNKHTYTSVGDVENAHNHRFTAGAWRSDAQLIGLSPPSSGRNSTMVAKKQRELLTAYFSSEIGSVSWQNDILDLN